MSEHDQRSNDERPAQPPELSERELARLRSAGGWARFIAITGIVVLALLMLVAGAVGIWNPKALTAMGFSRWVVVSTAITIAIDILATLFVLNYGRSVSSFFRGDGDALARAFRQLRFFLVLWTCGTALTALYALVRALKQL